MAASDNQGLQIALVIFVILTIALSVTTFMFFNQYKDSSTQVISLTERSTKADADLASAVRDMNAFKSYMGFPAEAAVADIQTGFEADMKSLGGANLPEDKKAYRSALDFLFNSFNEKNAALASAQKQIQTLNTEKAALEEEKNKRIAIAEAAQKAAVDDLTKERAKFVASDQKHQADLQQVQTALAQTRQQVDTLTVETKKATDELTNQLRQSNTTLELRQEELAKLTATSFEVPDGKVTQVTSGGKKVYINRGSADGLRALVTFGVYGSDANSVAKREKKASIEVVNILGDHLSEARVLDSTLANPIVSGDMIETPLWQPGRTPRFAIAGEFDVDSDGKATPAERDLIRTLISRNGGVIDAEVDDNGNATGSMSIDTRYLILGPNPSDLGAPGASQIAEARTQLIREANRLGVEVLNLDKFLSYIGYVNPQQLLRFGRGGNVEHIDPTIPDGGRKTAAGNVSELFRRRNPGESAYEPPK